MDLKFLFSHFMLLVCMVLAFYFSIRAIIKKENYFIGGIIFTLKKNFVPFILITLFELLIGISILLYFVWYLYSLNL